MTDLSKRPFDWNKFSPETQKKIDEFNKKAGEIANEDVDALITNSLELIEILEQEKIWQKDKYPENPPNHVCNTALITGILFSNENGLRVHDYYPYFSTGEEQTYIWTHSKNLCSSLIVDVDISVKSHRIWRSLASILELAKAISSSFELSLECNYDWIYYFDPNKSLEDSEFMNLESYDRLSGSTHKLSFLADQASLLELLYRDERFYVMGMNLLTSFTNHNFCLICAFKKDGYQEHPNHELPSWQVAQAIPKMEVAIVQATRAVEAVLGKPGKREDASKYQRVIKRWKEAIKLDPNEVFSLANKSYIDYYYDMFGIRGDAAHSLGSYPYYVSRQLTIAAQCFAWQILVSYFNQHSLSTPEARKELNFNMEFINKEPKGWSTTMTADSDRFPHEWD